MSPAAWCERERDAPGSDTAALVPRCPARRWPLRRVGRIIPVSAHLIEALSCWPRVGPYVIPSPPGSGDRTRQPRPREVARAWRDGRVPERAWKGAPHHAFRKGFKSGLLRAGAAPDAVDHLQGHVISGSRGRYIDPMVAYDLVEVVGRVPGIKLRAEGEAGHAR